MSTTRRVSEVLPAPAGPTPSPSSRSPVTNSRAMFTCASESCTPAARAFSSSAVNTSVVAAGITWEVVAASTR